MSRARDIADIGEDVTSLATDAELSSGLASKLDLAGGKILQIVRATNGSQFETTSTSYVDVTGITVTITPQKSNSSLLLLVAGRWQAYSTSATALYALMRITDSSDNGVQGSQSHIAGGTNITYSSEGALQAPLVMAAWATPATTSATTYKMQARVFTSATTFRMANNNATGQMFAIEVSA